MRLFLIVGASIVSLLTGIMPLQADDIPALNVEQVCRGIADHAPSPGEAGGPDLSFQQCVHSENNVRSKLSQRWSHFAPADKTECVGEATAGGECSYKDLLTCLQMARDVRAIRASNKKR